MEEDNQKHGRAHAFQRLGRLWTREGGGKSGGSVVSSQPLLLGCQKQFQEPKEVGRQLRGRARHARIPSILSLHEGRDAWGKERDSLATHRSDRSQNEQRKELLSQLS